MQYNGFIVQEYVLEREICDEQESTWRKICTMAVQEYSSTNKGIKDEEAQEYTVRRKQTSDCDKILRNDRSLEKGAAVISKREEAIDI